MTRGEKSRAELPRKVLAAALATAMAVAYVPATALAGGTDPVEGGGAVVENPELTDISTATAVVADAQTFTGQALTPIPTVTLNDIVLVEGTDFEVTSYANNLHAGTGTVTIAGIGSYTGTLDVSFAIAKMDITTVGFDVSGLEHDTVFTGYVGGGIDSFTGKSGGVVLELGEDFDIYYDDDATNIGSHSGRVVGLGDYTGEIPFTFNIVAADITDCDVEDIAAQAWTGSAIEPPISLSLGGKQLTEGTDYTVAYCDNVGGGTATAIVTGVGNITGTLELPFEIVRAAGILSIDTSDFSTLCPGSSATLHFTASADAVVNASSSDTSVAEVTVNDTDINVSARGAGNATIAVSTEATSGHSAAGPVYITVSVRDHSYTRWSLKTAPFGSESGTATRTCTRCGDTEIKQVSIVSAAVSLESGPFAVSGSPIEPSVTATVTDSMGNVYELVEGEDFTVGYRDNVAAGRATAVIASSWPKVSRDISFRIGTASIADAEVDGLQATYDYTGRRISRSGITLTLDNLLLIEGTDYKVSQSSTCAGIRKLTFTGIGSYTGKLQRSFLIDPPRPGKLKVMRLANGKIYARWGNLKCRCAKVSGYRVLITKKTGKVIKRVWVSGRNKSTSIVKLPSKYKNAKNLRISVASYKVSKGDRYISGESR